MKTSEVLYKAAERMKAGFSPFYHRGRCGCFMSRIISAKGSGWCDGPSPLGFFKATMLNNDPSGYHDDVLAREGWTTDDAVAALEIAADIAHAEGK